MKYTDEQRIQKIYDNAIKLNQYLKEHSIKREDLLTDYSLQWLVVDLFATKYNCIST